MPSIKVGAMQDELESLRAEVAQLRAAMVNAQAVIPHDWRLTATEERVFRVLLAVDTATRQIIHEGAGVEGVRSADIHILRIRRKTKRFGVEIETVRAKGWRLVGRFTWERVLLANAAA